MVTVGVVGSINMDFVVTAHRYPRKGETLFGETFGTNYGGKGANQAVAAARLGGETWMVGAVGSDDFGKLLLDNLTNNQINTQYVKEVPNMSSGSAVITIAEGDNSIIYVGGANNEVTSTDIDQIQDIITDLDIVLVQNETPTETIQYLIDVCDDAQIPIILNPAPARELATEYIDKVTYLTPNETEFNVLFGEKQSMATVLARYPNKLIITLGSKGAMFHDGEEVRLVPAYLVSQVVDTTGAGDTFNGAFAVAIASGLSVFDSVQFANLASSLSIQKHGAQSGIPTLNQLKESDYYEEAWDIE